MRKINLIVIHCSATRVTQDFTVGELEACHLARGFRDIGYHYYITKDGEIYPCHPESEPGAHTRHYNAHSIGISVTRVVWMPMPVLPTPARQRRRQRCESF